MFRLLVLSLLLAVVWFGAMTAPVERAVAGGGCRGVPSTSATGDAVKMSGQACFTPTVLFTEPGTTVTWTNESTEIHDVASATLEWGNYEEVAAGESVSYRFDQPGTYPYYCFVHNGMIGAIVVGDGAFVANGEGVSAAVETLARQPVSGGGEPGAQDSAPVAATATPSGDEDSSGMLVAAVLGVLLGGVGVAVVGSLRGAGGRGPRS